MTIDEVIQTGEVSWFELIFYFTPFEWIFLMILIPIMCGGVSLFCGGILSFGEEKAVRKQVLLIFAVLLFAFEGKMLFEAKQNTHPQQWKEEIANPFYENLPTTSRPLDIIGVNKTSNEKYFEFVYASKAEDGTIMHQSIIAPIKETKDVSEPTYNFKYVEKEVPGFKKKGKHEEVVYVPLGYNLSVNN